MNTEVCVAVDPRARIPVATNRKCVCSHKAPQRKAVCPFDEEHVIDAPEANKASVLASPDPARLNGFQSLSVHGTPHVLRNNKPRLNDDALFEKLLQKIPALMKLVSLRCSDQAFFEKPDELFEAHPAQCADCHVALH